ncbi:MAG: HD-GYP domain-containing protein [Hydrogenophilales bacterium]|nr:HD-GYP domain-containing protein [Hydrogenophilales bacterium]
MDEKIDAAYLQTGMFVAELDRPWLDTPFLFQGFLIETDEQIAELRQYCQYVLVDPLRSIGWNPPHKTPAPKEAPLLSLALAENPDGPFARNLNRYPDRAQLEEEMPRAKELHRQAEQAVQQLFEALQQHGATDLDRAHEVMDGMVESIICNPDALALLSRVKRASSYVYARSVSVAINMLLFGRHLGFPRDHMHLLGAAGLLLDVGTIKVPSEILSKNGQLTPEEYEMIKRHVQSGLDMLRESKGVSEKLLSIVAFHHEREDGSGYPHGLRGAEIGVPGKMAAIVDCYDALTSERPYARSFTPYDALQHLYGWREHLFHTELVEQFVQCLGIYPVGSLVELNSGEVAVVLAHNRVRRLKPRVLAILDAAKQPYGAPVPLDLLTAPKLVDDQPYQIVRALEHGMYGIDPRDYYL